MAWTVFQGRKLGNPMCVSSLRDHCPLMSHVHCIKNYCYIDFIQFFGCFRWKIISSSYYSISVGDWSIRCKFSLKDFFFSFPICQLSGRLFSFPLFFTSLFLALILYYGASQVALVVKNLPANTRHIRGVGSIGAWQATVHRVAKSQTWLKRLSIHACMHPLLQGYNFPELIFSTVWIFLNISSWDKRETWFFGTSPGFEQRLTGIHCSLMDVLFVNSKVVQMMIAYMGLIVYCLLYCLVSILRYNWPGLLFPLVLIKAPRI